MLGERFPPPVQSIPAPHLVTTTSPLTVIDSTLNT